MKGDFDWTEILDEPERSRVRAERRGKLEEFFDRFPTKKEIEQSAIEGRAAFTSACEQVEAQKIEREMMDLADHFAGTLLQPRDPRAWGNLLIYAPREALEQRLAALSPSPPSKEGN
jgi:hypothetical protein